MKQYTYLCLFTILLLLSNYSTSTACLNFYGTSFHHEETFFDTDFYLDYLLESVLSGEKHKESLERIKQYESELYKHKNDRYYLSNYAANLLYVGEIQKAITILEDLLQKYPEEYNLNANLGTAYELSGNLEKAKILMQKAVEINPKSHNSSEWIHLKILDAKIALQKNPNWLNSHTVLGIDFGQEDKPSSSKKHKELVNLSQQILYQLQERMRFVKPKDVIVGDLLFLLGDVYGIIYDVSYAVRAYKLAKRYGVSQASLLEKRLQTAQSMADQYPISDKPHRHSYKEKTSPKPEKTTQIKKVNVIKEENGFRDFIIGFSISLGILGLFFLWYKTRQA